MFPPMWNSPPCRNIDVTIVTHGWGKSPRLRASPVGQEPVRRHGVTPNSTTSASAAPAAGAGPSTPLERRDRSASTLSPTGPGVTDGAARDGASVFRPIIGLAPSAAPPPPPPPPARGHPAPATAGRGTPAR